MFEYPTPTPYPDLGGTPVPTFALSGMRELATETVQWWNQGVSLGIGPVLQIMFLFGIIIFAAAVISKNLQSIED